MNWLATGALVVLYVLYAAMLVIAVLNFSPARRNIITWVSAKDLNGVLVIQFVHLLCVLVLWLDHNPMSLLRLFLVVIIGAEIIYESLNGVRHYKKSIPAERRPIWDLIHVVAMLTFITLLAFVP